MSEVVLLGVPMNDKLLKKKESCHNTLMLNLVLYQIVLVLALKESQCFE